MRLFFNPLDGPLTGKKVIGIIVYLILAAISIWATSESIYSSFNIPKILSYLIGLVFISALALFLSIIKESFESRRVSIMKISFILFWFFFLWGVSLATNSHKLFTQLKLQDIRKNEIDQATIALENIERNSTSIGTQVINDYEVFVTSRIQDYKKEVVNVENCGHGPVADTLMSKVQRSMPGSIFTIPSGRPMTESGCRKLANDMADQMTSELLLRTTSMRTKIDELSKCDQNERRIELLEQLNSMNDFTTDFASIEVKEAISESHEYYNQLYECYNNGLVQSIGSVSSFTETKELKKKLELPVPSINLEKIAALIPFVKKYPKEKPGAYVDSLILSISIALILDLAAFIILYFVVLKEE
tara:strand:- start:16 stop:1098 length:1083 start_codon:yes stop_codon:yes gene_type:complete